MWRIAAGLEWKVIAQLSEDWATAYELSLARDFAEHLDGLDPRTLETACLGFQIVGTDKAGETMAKDLTKALEGKMVLGLQAVIGVPTRPEGPSVACQIRLSDGNALDPGRRKRRFGPELGSVR